jgi:hypothetical protein
MNSFKQYLVNLILFYLDFFLQSQFNLTKFQNYPSLHFSQKGGLSCLEAF